MKHYKISESEKQKKYNSSGWYGDGCLCGNGSFHADKTRDSKKVDCPKCLELLDSNPAYLSRRIQKTWLPCFNGFYESLHGISDFTIENTVEYELEQLNIPKSGALDYSELYTINQAYYTDYSKAYVTYMEAFFKSEGLNISFKFESLYSPREYNFSTDSINISVEYDQAEILEILSDNAAAFKAYIKEKNTARSGFIPFYSADSADWLRDFKDGRDLETKLGQILEFIALEVFSFEFDGDMTNHAVYFETSEYIILNEEKFKELEQC